MKRNRTGWNSSACIRVCQCLMRQPFTSTRPSLRQISVATTKNPKKPATSCSCLRFIYRCLNNKGHQQSHLSNFLSFDSVLSV